MGIEKRLIEDANLTRGMQLATPELSLIHISEPTRH